MNKFKVDLQDRFQLYECTSYVDSPVRDGYLVQMTVGLFLCQGVLSPVWSALLFYNSGHFILTKILYCGWTFVPEIVRWLAALILCAAHIRTVPCILNMHSSKQNIGHCMCVAHKQGYYSYTLCGLHNIVWSSLKAYYILSCVCAWVVAAIQAPSDSSYHAVLLIFATVAESSEAYLNKVISSPQPNFILGIGQYLDQLLVFTLLHGVICIAHSLTESTDSAEISKLDSSRSVL